MTKLANLTNAVIAVCPIDGIALLDPVAHTVRIDFKVAATAPQRTAANGVVAGFDWSDAAELSAQNSRDRTSAATIFMTDTSAAGKILRATILVLLDEINILRAASVPSLPARTIAQARTAIQNKIDGGTVD